MNEEVNMNLIYFEIYRHLLFIGTELDNVSNIYGNNLGLKCLKDKLNDVMNIYLNKLEWKS